MSHFKTVERLASPLWIAIRCEIMNDEHQTKVDAIKRTHQDLKISLLEFLHSREMKTTISTKDGHKIAKPRFLDKKQLLPSSLRSQVNSHLEQIDQLFQQHSYKSEEISIYTIDPSKRYTHKKSALYLLQEQSYRTDEVYGDYLLESDHFHYYRNHQKRMTKPLPQETLEDALTQDMFLQLETQFLLLWDMIEQEIDTAIEAGKSLGNFLQSNINLREHLLRSENLLQTNPIAATLMMGRTLEMLCILLVKDKNILSKMIDDLKHNGDIDVQQYQNLNVIRKFYNKIKHDYNIAVDREELESHWKYLNDIIEDLLG